MMDMARVLLFKSEATGLVEQIVVADANDDEVEQFVDLRGDEFGAQVLVFGAGISVEFG